jgi:deazaflavin-dependent oxidoreductase (nitroreductase family)
MRVVDRRSARVLLVVVLAVGLAPTGLVFVLRIFRRNRDVLLRPGPFRSFLKRYNDITRKISGTQRSSLGLLTHVGRRSGRSYQTSLGATAYRDGFLVPLTYGPRTDWYRNLTANGAGTLAWKGHTYRIERPEIISGPEPMRVWPMGSRIMLRLAGVHDFVWMHESQAEGG